MIRSQQDEEIGELVPFPLTNLAPAITVPAEAELESRAIRSNRDDQFRGLVKAALAGLPARWQDRDHLGRVGPDLVRHALQAPFRYPAAVGRGSAVAVRAWWGWISVRDFYEAAKQAQQLALRFDDIQRYRVRRRWWTLGLLVATGGGLVVGDLIEGAAVVWCAAGVLSAGLAIVGRRSSGSGRSAVIRPRSIAWAMDGNNLVTAFQDAKMVGKDEGLAFVQLPKRDGDGWAIVVDLPPSRKASTVIARREDLASALAVDEMQLVVERVRGRGGHAGRLSLWIADHDPYAAKPSVSPLAQAESCDLWQPAPFGTTARGQRVNLPLVWTSLLVGAIPRMGKTYVMRLPLTAAALDPHVRLIVADGKGGKDHRPFELVAHRFIPNSRADSIVRLIAVLEEAATDVEDRFGRLADLDDEICPESKVTPAISRDPRFAMPLTVIGIDEVQNYLEDETPLDPDVPKGKKRGQRVLELLTFIAKTGPAAGFMLVLATQKPDSQVIPDKLRGQLGTRFALKVMTWQASETILGAGTYKAGMDAAKLLKSHKGVGLLLGADGETDLDAGEAITVKTDLLEIKAVRRACQRGRALREATGTLTGDAIDDRFVSDLPADVARHIEEEAARVAHNSTDDRSAAKISNRQTEVLALLLDVIDDQDHDVMSTAELASRLGPEWDAKRLGEALRAAGIPRPTPAKQRASGAPYPVPVQSIDAIKTAIHADEMSN